MGNREPNELFTSRTRIKRWQSYGGIFHVLSVLFLSLSILWAYPQLKHQDAVVMGEEIRQKQELRQLLLESLDKLVRYEKYFREINGRYTRDLSNLSLPEKMASGNLEDLRRRYEISVLELHPNRFLLIASGVGNSDRVTIDESFRLNANFILPPPSKAYLFEEADRLLRLKMQGTKEAEGIYARYWRVQSAEEQWYAIGIKSPVLGEKHEIRQARLPASIFNSVSKHLQTRMSSSSQTAKDEAANQKSAEKSALPLAFKEKLSSNDVNDWLIHARQAQHIFKRERGRYARKWEELDLVSNFRFADRIRLAKNIRVHPMEISDDDSGFQLVLEGTSGDLLGEQFTTDKEGAVRQVRYTDTLIQQLQETTDLLENTFRINPVKEDVAPFSQP